MEEALLVNGFDSALLGFGRRFNSVVAVYSYAKCVALLVKESGMSEEEAHEYMDYNVIGAFVGDKTPIFMIEVDIDDRESLQ